MRRSSLLVGPVALALAVGAVGCGGDATTSDPAASVAPDTTGGSGKELPLDGAVDLTGKAEVTIAVDDNVYDPKVFSIDPGATVTFVNEGNNAHNVIPVVEGAFNPIETGSLDPGMSATVTFSTEGAYRFYCSIHGSPRSGQRGAAVVGNPPTE